ncbi:MAG TPA: MG2 domain-containing protein, partial [Candidatus Didemnitutus sp.]|nr:MG2 domain-containing protein [Candidatus Didemnitutus sp.]
ILFRALLLLLVVTTGFAVGPREEQWKKVREASQAGLPKSAIEALDPIIAGARADQAYAEAVKAVALKIALEAEVEGDKPDEKIVRLQTELAQAPAPMKPLMEAILAHWYWQYFQQNRWRIAQRTESATEPGNDFRTWDLPRLLAEIDRHFTAALANEKKLKSAPIADYNDLLAPGSAPDRYRPTLYDFLAYEALSFYTAGEHGGRRAEDEFELDANGPILGSTADFAAWQPATTDVDAPLLKAVRLYQALLAFHGGDADRSAYDDADLARLTFGHNLAVGDEKEERFDAALGKFIARTEGGEISARAMAALATQLHHENKPVAAHALAKRGLEAFPESAGGAQCFNLLQQIEAKFARLETERVWNAPWPTLDVTYRNVTKVYFRAVKADFKKRLSSSRWNVQGIDDETRRWLLDEAPVLAWSADLPATTDYTERTERLPAPTTLAPGFYFIVASHDPTFGEKDNQLSGVAVWVSELALVLRSDQLHGTNEGFVLRATTGKPVAGATIRTWERGNDGRYRPAGDLATDEDGRFEFTLHNRAVLLLAEADGQAIASMSERYGGGESRERADTQTVFFTDRAIYRPGQTISYKGIAMRYDRPAGKYAALADQKLTVVFSDPNGKEIARAEHTTNDYGSFNGVFTAPRDRLTGRMSIRVLGRPSMTWFNVEEYKRPKFQVELPAPAVAAKLDALVQLTGKATAYTGAAIGGAKVKWRVTRGVQLPYWCWWWRPVETKAIAHGTAVSEADGTFKIEFTATPDRSVPAKNEPVFVYTVHADVTDTTGETRSDDRTVRAGYAALQAAVAVNEWQTPAAPVELSVATTSLDGDAQKAAGSVTIHALKQPDKVERASLQGERRYWFIVPADPKPDPANPDSWEIGGVVAEQSFTTDASGKTKLTAQLPAGIYRAVLATKDRFGTTVTARQTFQVVDPGARAYGIKLPNHFGAPRWSLEPGEKFTALWGTGYDTGRAYVEVLCNGKRLKNYWTDAGRSQETIEQAVSEEMRGGFTVRATFVRENRAYINERIVDVPWSNKQLSVKWESFRSKLLPGQKETWTAIVTGPDSKRTAAEMVATLYDASLDQFIPAHW